jgi:hypothetical protein
MSLGPPHVLVHIPGQCEGFIEISGVAHINVVARKSDTNPNTNMISIIILMVTISIFI